MTKRERLNLEYKNERKRIQNYISYRKKKGFVSEFTLPKIPKNIREGSIRKLKKITAKNLREYETKWVDQDTGEVFEGEHRHLAKLEKNWRKQKKQREQFIDAVIPDFAEIGYDNFIEEVRSLPQEIQDVIFGEIDVNVANDPDYKRKLSEFVEENGYLREEDLYKTSLVRWYFKELENKLNFRRGTQSLISDYIDSISFDAY